MPISTFDQKTTQSKILKLNVPYSSSFRGKVWSLSSTLQLALLGTAKAAGCVFLKFTSLACTAAFTGELGSVLADLRIIKQSSASSWDSGDLNLRVTNSWILNLSEICANLTADPVINLRALLWENTPLINYSGIKISKLFIGTALEDIMYLGLIQRTALPLLAKLLPKHCGYVLNHKVTRVAIASAIFALAHDEYAKTSPCGVLPQFIGGLISGAIAELNDSLFFPIVTHFAYDLILIRRIGGHPDLA